MLLSDKDFNNISLCLLYTCSAGGLATYLHADMLPSLLPKDIKYKTMADAGYVCELRKYISYNCNIISFIIVHFSYFLNIPDVNGDRFYMAYMQAGESMNMLLAGIAHHFCALTTGSVACTSV